MRIRYIDDDDDEVLRDGECLRVPLRLMDSDQRAVATHFANLKDADLAGHRPGSRFGDDSANDARETAYRNYQTNTENAWRRGPQRDAVGAPGHVRKGVCVPDRKRTDALTRDEAYAAYDHDIQTAWRNP